MNLTSFAQSKKADSPHYLLFGHPVEHSLSPMMHNTALDYYDMEGQYYAIDLQQNELSKLASYLNRKEFLGANITIPYKQIIMDYVDGVDQSAREIEAVNTLVKQDYALQGYNTDLFGFLSPLEEYENQVEGTRAIVFGTGGAARAIVAGLVQIGVEEIYLISRNPERISSFKEFEQVEICSYHEWTSLVDEASLVINATPLGMSPNVEKSPVRESEKQFLADCVCYDIVYNPLKTKFLSQAEEVGADTIGGLEMLIQQGSRSFKLWTGRTFPVEIIREKLYERFKN